MRFILAALWLFCMAAFSFAYALQTTDDLGRVVILNHPAKRLIVLSPDAVETVFAIGAGNRLVRVVSGSDYPAAARHLPVVGSASSLDLERMVALQPDLIVIWGGGFLRPLQPLLHHGVAVFVTQPEHLDDVPKLMRRLGVLLGEEASANKAARAVELAFARAFNAAPPHPVKRVFFELAGQPLMTVNGKSWISEAITRCGGVNIFAESPIAAPTIDWEAAVAANPDVIISDATTADWTHPWQRFPFVTAIAHHALYTINPDLIERASPRLPEGVAAICAYLAG